MYQDIEYKVAENLVFAHKKCLSFDELLELVPTFDSPFYSVKRVQLVYMERMSNLKPRGEEWNQLMSILREEL